MVLLTATIKVTDANNSTYIKDLSITINAAPIVTTTGALPNGEINLLYSYQLLVSGGVGPFTWIHTTGNWPAGLSLSSTGLISGTPTALGGPATLTIKATDSLRASSTVSVNITIVSGPAITTGSTLNAGEVSAYYTNTLAATGGVLPYTWTKTTGTLPPGLSLSSAGVISGTPTASVSSNFGVLLTDYMGGTASG